MGPSERDNAVVREALATTATATADAGAASSIAGACTATADEARLRMRIEVDLAFLISQNLYYVIKGFTLDDTVHERRFIL
mmetsp:Transcript_9327/g.14856  ORF Transcript_9327/g.14856 Transcript_9327/m.14856 type:complete len:81 (+) Transcript_9327:1016-1258(+)